MESFLSLTLKSSFHHKQTPVFNKPITNSQSKHPPIVITKPNSIIQTLQLTAKTIIFSALITKFHNSPPAFANPLPQTPLTEPEKPETDTQLPENNLEHFLETNPESIESLKSLLQTKLEAGEDEESLALLKKLVTAQPENQDFKFLLARLLNEMGDIENASMALGEILEKNPLSFDALFENALLMDSVGEGGRVLERLEQALEIARNEGKEKEARDIRLIIAQFQFLQKNVEESLRSYDELMNEDPNDFRPYFCKGMIFSLIDRNDEAKVEFEKYRALSPKKFEVEGYIRTPLSRMKLFGSDEQN